MLRSPNELLEAAKQEMLAGSAPSTRTEWQKVFNFFAFNVSKEVQPAALIVLGIVFDAPLTKEEITEISNFQVARQ